MKMRPGKVPPELLQRLVYPHLNRRGDVLVHARLGEDCAALDFGEWTCVVTTDPITAARYHLGRLAAYVSCNDLATTGAEPVGMLLTLLLKEGTPPEELDAIMRDAERAAADLGVEIVGGHTEITPGIDRTIAVVTAIGRVRKGEMISAAGAKPGESVILTKGVGLEGTAILATDLADRLRGRVDDAVLARARMFIDRISVVPEGLVAARHGATAMHDVTEGGVLAGAWELAEAAGAGIELRADAVPVLPETAAICDALGVDPLGLISSGAMLITSKHPRRTVEALGAAGIPAAEVGVMTEGERVVVRRGVRTPLVPLPRDELWRVLEEVQPAS